MRFLSLTILTILLSTFVVADPPADIAGKELTPNSSIDEILDALDARGKDFKTFTANVTLKEESLDLGGETARSGKVWYQDQGNGKARIHVKFETVERTAGKTINDCPIPSEALDELVNLIDSGKISGKQGKEVFSEMFSSGKGAAAIVKKKGIEQLSDTSAIEKFCDEVIAANPKSAADFKAGNAASLNFLKGQVMKLSKGKANPQLAGEILERKLQGATASKPSST